MVWKSVSLVFKGGTEAARALRGRHVRPIVSLLGVPTVDAGKPGMLGETTDLAAWLVGFVGDVPDEARELITIGFPKAGAKVESLEALSRKPFTAVRVNWPTFQRQFEIET